MAEEDQTLSNIFELTMNSVTQLQTVHSDRIDIKEQRQTTGVRMHTQVTVACCAIPSSSPDAATWEVCACLSV